MKSLQAGSYSIFVGPLAKSLPPLLGHWPGSAIFVLVDEHTRSCCWPILQPLLPKKASYTIIKIPAGESFKHLRTCEHIWQSLLQAGADRNAILLNLGGGVIGDMGGFCAAAYKRGIEFIQIPTTLLSQVDASIGGKLGIDFGGLKNSIGFFKDPFAVCIDPQFWQTLPPREFRSGFAEVIKHSLIADAGQWRAIRQAGTPEAYMTLPDTLQQTLEIKRKIVQEDPFEKGIRKALNFGHTIGHAVESWALESDSPLLHGEAVALGMIAEAQLSTFMAGLSEQEALDISHLLGNMFKGLPELPEEAFGRLLELMSNDKKNTDGRINFTLLERCGQAVTDRHADKDAISRAMRMYNEFRKRGF